MHVISRKRLNDFADKHPDVRNSLDKWHKQVKKANFISFAELRETFSNVDKVGKLTIFNIGGNKARLIAAIHYNRRKVYIRAVLTHPEYDKNKWKE